MKRPFFSVLGSSDEAAKSEQQGGDSLSPWLFQRRACRDKLSPPRSLAAWFATRVLVCLAGGLLAGMGAGCHQMFPKYNTFSPLTNRAAFASVTLSNRLDPALLQPSTNLFTLGPGDKVDIEYIGQTNTLASTVVGPDGRIYYDLAPGIDVWGLTLAQAKAQIEDALSQYVREKPQVSLTLRGVESKRVWILGRVQTPGVYPLSSPMTLLEALSLAGGTLSLTTYQDQEAAGMGEELADLQRSFVLRHGQRLPVDFQRLIKGGDLSQNIYLQPGDFVYLPAATAREVYVLGAVLQPRAVPYKEGLTVAAAIASANGTVQYAYMHHVTVVRGSFSQPQVATVDYKNVIRGEAPDIVLQPRDIVYVPYSPYRYAYRYAQLAVETFVSAAAINAGSSAVSRGTFVGGTGVFIPVGTGIQTTPAPVVVPPK